MAEEKARKPRIDWEAVEIHYRAGVRSLKDIGNEYGVSDAGILKRANRDGWTRDLAAKIKAKADAKVSAAAVSAEVSAEKVANQNAVVEANAEIQYRIRMEHRQDISKVKDVFKSLVGELAGLSKPEGMSLVEQLFELIHGDAPDDEEGNEFERRRIEKMRERLNRVLDMPGRVDSAKKITEMLEKLVKLEREAFGIDDKKAADTSGAINISF